MVRRLTLVTLLSLLLWTPALAQAPDKNMDGNPPTVSVAMEGVPNFHKVATNFYRSGQPSEAGFRRLVQQYGIRTVINLRTVARDEPITIGLPLHVHPFPIRPGMVAQDRANVVAALRALRVAMREGPTLLHCEHGSDRTGMITALYRILYEGVSKKDAVREMRKKAFGFHPVWQNIPRFIENVDIAQLRRDVDAH